MRTIKQGASPGYFVDGVYKSDTFLAEPFHHRAVVDNFVIDINWRAKKFQGSLEAFDGHIHASAKSPRIGQNYSQGTSIA